MGHRSIPFAALALVPVLASLSADSGGPEPDDGSRTLTRDEARLDLELFRDRLFGVHPDPYRHRSRPELESEIQRTIAALPDGVDLDALFVSLATVAASIRDSHTAVAPPRQSSELRLPFRIFGDRAYLSQDVGKLPAGSRITHVDGRAIEDLIAVARPLAPGETEAAVDVAIAQYLGFVRRRLGSPQDSAVLRGTSSSGSSAEVTVSRQDLTRPEQIAFESVRFPDGTVYLRLTTMFGELAEFRRAFIEFFTAIEDPLARGLIVDLRENAGGSTIVGQMLLEYVTRRRHRMFGLKRWRVSREMQHAVRNEGAWAGAYLAALPNTILEQEPPISKPTPVPHRFAGPCVLLIGPRTRSAAMMTANAARDFGLALVVGTPTSSPPNYFAEAFRFVLPHSRLEVSISTAEFVRANGDYADPAVVLPHVEAGTPRAVAAANDETVGAAVMLIDRFHEIRDAGRRSSKAAARPDRAVTRR